MKQKLLGKNLEELTAVCVEHNLPKFTAKQIADWVYKKKVSSIDEMTNLSIKARTELNEQYEVGITPPCESVKSSDGTIKYLFKIDNKHLIESVFIPTEGRATLCVSSQVGCKMRCSFCMTGKQGFQENLSSNEILNQIHSIPESEELTNLVFMGMGEPLDNYENLLKTLQILTAPWGYAMSPRRITVSTIGVIPNLIKLLEETDVHIAISLHSPFSEERLSIMPIENAYPFENVIELLRRHDFTGQRRLSFEYIMFSGFNDSLRHADNLARILQGMPCRVNLIRFHAIPDSTLKSSDSRAMELFKDRLTQKHLICTIRTSRGEDIFAACGMLSSIKERV